MRAIAIRIASVAMGAAFVALGALASPAAAAPAPKPIAIYQDLKTGVLTTIPGKGKVYVGTLNPGGTPAASEESVKEVQNKTQQQLDEQKAEFNQKLKAQQDWNGEVAKQMSDMAPKVSEFGDRWYKKISVGTLIYGDYGYFTHTGFGPQFLTQQVWPGVGNSNFNSFDITRAYLDFKFTPSDDLMARVTPNVYTSINTGAKCTATPKKGAPGETVPCTASSGDAIGNNTGWGQRVDGNLAFRLKYAYLDYNTFFKKVLPVQAMAEDKFTFGQEQNPYIDWEEQLWGYRYTALVPWNYLSLSSTQVGVSMKGPIKFNEKQYADYDFGVFNDGSYSQIEQGSYKQAMGRVTVNPLGAKSRYDSLGLTYFYDYGWPNKANDVQDGHAGTGASKTAAYAHIMRMAALLHYNADPALFDGWGWGLIGEWDYGNNAFSSGNLYSGSGPSDAIGVTSLNGYGPWNKMVGALLGTGQATQMGWDVMGHLDIKNTPFTIFGLWQAFQPNTQSQIATNPLDFYRYDLGLQYLINKNLRVAFTAQGINYHHSQFTFPKTQVGSTTIAETPFAVPRDTHAFFLNFEFKY